MPHRNGSPYVVIMTVQRVSLGKLTIESVSVLRGEAHYCVLNLSFRSSIPQLNAGTSPKHDHSPSSAPMGYVLIGSLAMQRELARYEKIVAELFQTELGYVQCLQYLALVGPRDTRGYSLSNRLSCNEPFAEMESCPMQTHKLCLAPLLLSSLPTDHLWRH